MHPLGFTVPEVDKILEKYAEKSYQMYKEEFLHMAETICDLILSYDDIPDWEEITDSYAHNFALNKVERDFEQGWQGIEYKLNTVGSSRGDYPFITMTFGLSTSRFGKMASITFLNVHKEGQGKNGYKKPVLFPKLVFLYDEKLHGKGCINEDVFEAGIECSSKTMYPDWLSLSGDGYVPEMYKKYGKVVSPMGCVDGQEVVTYKFNKKLYVEAFERMWYRLADYFKIKNQSENSPHLYMDLSNVEIYDTKNGFVNTKRIIRNLSDNWVDVHLSNGRRLLCTSDHPFEVIGKGKIYTNELVVGDKMRINSSQYSENNISFISDRAWLLGFLLCDGCYQNNRIFASVAATKEDDIANKFVSVIKEQFGLQTDIILQERGIKGTYKDLCIRADKYNGLQKMISYLSDKFGGINKLKRQIPNEVFSWNKEAKFSFLAGMIDADGHINNYSHGGCTVQIGSTNKEISLQQMALAQALGMPARMYHNHYSKRNPELIRYRIEFKPTKDLLNYIVCKKKIDHYIEPISDLSANVSEVIEVIPLDGCAYSYDVTTDSEHFEVSGVYSHNCRAFLSPWYEKGGMYPEDENDTPIFVGRFNIGAVSLHLPMILAKSRKESKDFYKVLDYYLELIRGLHKRTYEYLGEMRASTNPVGYCEGGFYGGNLKPEDKIKSILKPMTASFGITALNELQMLYNHKSITEDGQFALEVLTYINDKINEFKNEDGWLYAIYGTPAESLCGLQIEQFRKIYGIIDGVSSRTYVSNSFHCGVWEDINPIEKQDLEGRFWNLCNGGKIQYVRYPIGYNKDAIRTLVRRAMAKGFYEGVNLSLSYCEDCGYEELEMDTCPKCGSTNLTKIDRMNGYLSYSRIKGDTRLNSAKMDEIADRKSM